MNTVLLELCRELLLIKAAHHTYLASMTEPASSAYNAMEAYAEVRAKDDDFMATVSDFRVDCAIKYGQVLAARFKLEDSMRKTQAHEAVRAMVELRGTPYTDPKPQSEQNKIET